MYTYRHLASYVLPILRNESGEVQDSLGIHPSATEQTLPQTDRDIRDRARPTMACQEALPGSDLQMDSPLYRLPQELRDQIFAHLFDFTRLSYSERYDDIEDADSSLQGPRRRHRRRRLRRTRVRPDPNALAILRTCRRTRREIGDSWIGRVTFCFAEQETMLDVLTALSSSSSTSTTATAMDTDNRGDSGGSTLSKVRRVRVGGRKLELGFPGSKFRACHGLASALTLLPPAELDLDVLTVLGDGGLPRHDYETLDALVRAGAGGDGACGWRELRFVSRSSALLGYANQMPVFMGNGGGGGDDDDDDRMLRFWRRPQPAHWREALEARDGGEKGENSESEAEAETASAGSSVTVYRSTRPGQCGAVLDERTRETYEQTPTEGQGQGQGRRAFLDSYGIWGDEALLADGEREKEMMVVVRRGTGADRGCKEGSSPVTRDDVWEGMSGKTWPEIRRDHVDILHDDGDLVEDVVGMDSYEDVDEYVWADVPTQSSSNIYGGL